MKKTYLYLAELVRAELYHRKPAEKPEDISWKEVLELAAEHMVVSLTFDSLRRLEEKPQGEIYRIWKELSDKALVKEISFDAERTGILQEFEEAGIKYLPLKGILIKSLYKRPGLRQFSDNDILYDRTRQADVAEIMKGRGYEGEKDEGNHDVYQKPPIFNFELHTELLPEENSLQGHFRNIWERAVKDEDNQMGYHMSEEDFYLFHIVHLEKHFGGGGTGLRYFVDQYYLRSYMVDKVSRRVLEQGLEEMGMLEFERRVDRLTERMFGDSGADWEHIFDGNRQEEEMFLYVMSSGAYGNFDNLVENKIKKSGNKFRYFLSRLTCGDVYLKHDYPVLYKAPWLKPVFVVWRLISAPFKKTEKVKAEFRALFRR